MRFAAGASLPEVPAAAGLASAAAGCAASFFAAGAALRGPAFARHGLGDSECPPGFGRSRYVVERFERSASALASLRGGSGGSFDTRGLAGLVQRLRSFENMTGTHIPNQALILCLSVACIRVTFVYRLFILTL